ncbi:hypothetical protein [Arabiibacter massiliensis]|uniref:hypothetical protein n=1 Tax=Arabiibacter massiliensis TaxID=1870985 RepID=UPI0009BA4C50|nr:hypothetical protein [Arabiibacter massiliensis]
MAATVKTLIEHHGELYWGTRTATPGYHYGLALELVPEGVIAQVVYVMSDLDEDDEPLVTPDDLLTCYTTADLEAKGIVLSDLMEDEGAEDAIGWYCIEESLFEKERVDELLESNERLDGYLDIVLQIMLVSPEEVAAGLPSLDEIGFFDLLDELEGVSEKIDRGEVARPLPFKFRLVGDALLGWEFSDEADFH